MTEAGTKRPGRLVLVSVPKSGTHLVSRLTDAMGYRLMWRLFHEVPEVEERRGGPMDPEMTPYGRCLVVHRMSEERQSSYFREAWAKRSIQVVLHVRDPRDVLLSALDYLLHKRQLAMPLPGIFKLMDRVQSMGDRARQLEFLMDEDACVLLGPLHPIRVFRDMRYLRGHPGCLSLRFEDLVGAWGRGCDRRRLETVAQALYWAGSDRDAAEAAIRLYNPGEPMYNRGDLGRWRDEMSEPLLRRFAGLYGDVLADYGYE